MNMNLIYSYILYIISKIKRVFIILYSHLSTFFTYNNQPTSNQLSSSFIDYNHDDYKNIRNTNTHKTFKHNLSSDYHCQTIHNIKSSILTIDDFLTIKLIGRGTYGKVILAKHIKNQTYFAIKILKKDVVSSESKKNERLLNEINALKSVSFPFINQMKFIIENETLLYIGTTYVSGESLRYYLKKEVFFPEEKACFYIIEIILILEYLHSNQILYRDLKPENLLLHQNGHIQLIDFGLCINMKEIQSIRKRTYSICGTPRYIAPEVLSEEGYSYSVDIWSLGILFYELIVGETPFQVIDKLDKFVYKKKIVYSKRMTRQCYELILSILEVDVSKRIGINQIKSHEYFRNIIWEEYLSMKISPPFIPLKNINLEHDGIYNMNKTPVPSRRKINRLKKELFYGK